MFLFAVCLLFTPIRADDVPCKQESACVCIYPNGSSIDLSLANSDGIN